MPIRKKKHSNSLNKKRKVEHNGIYPYLKKFNEIHKVQGTSKHTLKRRDSALRRFIEWCDEREVQDPKDVTRAMLERYQRHLYYYRKSDGEPLSVSSQNVFLSPLKTFFKWLTKENYILYNPASELVLPKKPKRLPKSILSVDEMLDILDQPDINTPQGIRDRAILETFYSTGMRRSELTDLKIYDIDAKRKTVLVQSGKGNKDRYIPVGKRALFWIEKYRLQIRSLLAVEPDDGTLYLTDYGESYSGELMTALVKRYIAKAGIDRRGAAHLFRHAMATHMLENGADIRFIQAMLGHASLETTQIYTQVSIEKMVEIHGACHPAGRNDEIDKS